MISRQPRWIKPFVRHLNQLADSSNPYLLSHASNPVHWKLWSNDTLALAKKQNKPIFLSVGYHSCHWCHVMNHECFENNQIAEQLNKDFVSIKIDKEEWPDLDSIYMMYLQATTGAGGWPLNVFLTPNLQPIFAGTYWAGPETSQEALKSLNAVPFSNVLSAVHQQWSENNKDCVEHAQVITENLASLVASKTSQPINLDIDKIIQIAEQRLKDTYDETHGGYGQAPKFPLAATLKFGVSSSDHDVRYGAIKILEAIFKGGIKDQIYHGIARYSVTSDWHLPHFEKMLVDQALILDVTLDDLATHQFAHDLTDFLVKGPLRSPEGWYSAVDADSLDKAGEPHEGEYYCWTYAEFEAALKGLPLLDVDICAMYYGVNEKGNINEDLDPHGEFAYKNVLSAYKPIREIAATFGRKPDDVRRVIEEGTKKLLDWRVNTKTPPQIDTKVVTGWNGSTIGALARSYKVLGRRDALSAATEGVKAIYNNNWDGELFRTGSSTRVPAVNDDYAYLIGGLIDLYDATLDTKFIKWASELQKIQIEKFWDPNGGFYTSQNWDWLIFRPKAVFDSAEPSSNGLSLKNLYRLGCATLNVDYLHKAQNIVDSYSADIEAQPPGYLSMLRVISALKNPQVRVIVGDDEARAAALIEEIKSDEIAPVVRINKDSIALFGEIAGNGKVFEKLWTETEGAQSVLVNVF